VARELAANNAAKPKSVVAAGGLVLEVLGVDGEATRMDLDGWVNGANLTVTTMRDPDGLYPQSRRALETRELSYVIDLRTMKIVTRIFGSYGGGQTSIDALNAAIDDILLRLRS
jgi:hypothetical protein